VKKKGWEEENKTGEDTAKEKLQKEKCCIT
jgi:hypothetical protein